MPERLKHKIRSRTVKDVYIILIVVVISFIFFSSIDAYALLSGILFSFKQYHLDQLIPTLFVLTVCLTIFSYRRWQEAKYYSLYCEELSLTDPLTNLPNRRAIKRLLNQTTEHEEYPASLLMINIIGLEEKRNVLGLSVAEHILIDLLYHFSSKLSDEQLICYWQSGQFVIFCPKLNKRQAEQLAFNINNIKLDNKKVAFENITFHCVHATVESESQVLSVIEDLEELLQKQIHQI